MRFVPMLQRGMILVQELNPYREVLTSEEFVGS